MCKSDAAIVECVWGSVGVCVGTLACGQRPVCVSVSVQVSPVFFCLFFSSVR